MNTFHLIHFLAQTTGPALAPATTGSQPVFSGMIGVLSQLVVISMMMERAFAFVFEQDGVVWLLSKPDPADKTTRVPRIPGGKSVLVAGCSIGVAFAYKFDVLAALFTNAKEPWPEGLGYVITGLIIAGGSAAAISLFQGVLGMSKDARDAKVDASKTSARAEKTKAEAGLAHANADKAGADLRLNAHGDN